MDYKKAGVDIEAGYKSVELMKEHVKKTGKDQKHGGAGALIRNRWLRHQGKAGDHHGQA